MARERVHEYESTQNYDFDIRPGETDLEYYRRIAKTADQRLVRLEALRHEKGFASVDKFAYARAMRDLEVYGGGKRFNTKPPEDPRLYREKVTDILRFLKSPTSTKRGIIEVYEKRAQTINEKYNKEGVAVTWRDIAALHDAGVLQTAMMETGIGSDTVWQAIGTIKADAQKIKKILKDGKKNQKTEEAYEPRDDEGKLTDEAVEKLKEAGVLTDTPRDTGVLYFLNDEELLKHILNL